MKSDIHPDYREVVFKDNKADFAILTRSVDAMGRVEKFKKKFGGSYGKKKKEK